VNKYLNGTILEMLERAKTLKTKIPTIDLPECFHQLAINCSNEIDSFILTLEGFINDPKYQVKANLSRKLIDFQEEIQYFDYLENKIIAPLHRWKEDDVKFTKLIQKVCKEINFPLIPPVASRLSQEYYCIDTKFNHMRVPLLEAEYLLHMPDLYHELSHSLIASRNNPNVTEFQIALGEFIDITDTYCQAEITNYRRNNGESEARKMEIFNNSWISWSIELFCDLFAVYTLGPAYAWANLHLCVKRGGNPYETPIYHPNSHPADNARMKAILIGLELIDYKKESKSINNYWDKYLEICSSNIDANYKIAFPNELLNKCAVIVLEATKKINCKIANPKLRNEVFTLLNIAWEKFTNDPIEYIGWEKLQREKNKFN